jgi:hypothetical protein
MTDLTIEEKRPHNSTLAIGGVSSPLDIPIAIGIVVAESSVLRVNFCAEKPAHRKSAKRYAACLDDILNQEINVTNQNQINKRIT